LVVWGGNPLAFNSVPLIIYNNSQLIHKLVALYIRGAGIRDGFITSNESMNLVIAGIPGSYTIGVNNIVDLVVNGGPLHGNFFNRFIPLSLISDDFNSTNNNITLYASGGVPPIVNQNMTLVIPKSGPSLTASISLYEHGF
jgi:hypothetical protein